MSMIIDDICTYAPKSGIKAGEATKDGQYMFFTSSEDESKRYTDYLYDGEGIIMGTGGNATLHYYHGKYAVSTDCIVLRPDDRIRCKYLYYFFLANMSILEAGFKGAGLKHTNKKYIGSISIPEIPSIDEQDRVIVVLDKVIGIIKSRKHEIDALDDLIKARFVEMFGDPVSNPKRWEKKALSEEAEIKIGPFGSLLHKEDYITGGHALVNPSHIIDGKIAPDDKLTISDEKYDELSAYHLRTGDVVMGRRGEMGRCAVVEQPGLLCGTGSLLIRTNGDLSADYIQKIISFPSFKRAIEDMAVGQTMPNLNVPIVSAFQIIKPPKSVQDQYYAFVAQIDKSKVVVQKALDEAQILFDSLMQQYFG